MSLEAGHLGNSGSRSKGTPTPHSSLLHNSKARLDNSIFQGSLTDVTASGVRDPVTHLSVILFLDSRRGPSHQYALHTRIRHWGDTGDVEQYTFGINKKPLHLKDTFESAGLSSISALPKGKLCNSDPSQALMSLYHDGQKEDNNPDIHSLGTSRAPGP